jgi:hypothetical protein
VVTTSMAATMGWAAIQGAMAVGAAAMVAMMTTTAAARAATTATNRKTNACNLLAFRRISSRVRNSETASNDCWKGVYYDGLAGCCPLGRRSMGTLDFLIFPYIVGRSNAFRLLHNPLMLPSRILSDGYILASAPVSRFRNPAPKGPSWALQTRNPRS